MGKDDEVTIGFWYSMGMQMGFGRGPIDELVQIRVADQVAWSGSVTSSTSFSINQENLFGGEKGEGGIVGTFTLQMGDASQAVLPALQNMLGGVVPAFRGVTTAFYDGKFCALNPYPKPWTFRVRRNLKGWINNAVWYSAKAVISMAGGTIKAQNPAHIIYECLTNPSWGRGLTTDVIDLVQLAKVADTLYAEGFGLCFRWIRQGSVSEFLQTMLDHIGGVISVDRRTGLLTVTLVRDDYTLASIPHFDYTNGLVKVEDLEVSSLDLSTNSVAVSYRDPIDNQQKTCAPVQNLAGVQISGAVNATTIEYFAIPTADLASRVALRDLQANIGILKRVKLHMNHKGWDLAPGRVISISVPSLGIDNMVLRIGTVEPGAIDDAEITITALEDIFGLPATSYVAPEPPGYVPPDRIARNVTTVNMIEASWADLCRFIDQGNLNTITPTQACLMVTGLKPTGLATHFYLWNAANTAALSSAVNQAHGDWCPSGIISADIVKGATPIAVVLGSGTDLDLVKVGEIARINDEDFRVDAINLSTNTFTLARAVSDTTPQDHALGSRIWFYQRAVARDLTRRVSGDVIYNRLQTKTSGDLLTLSAATIYSVSLTARQGKPYPPRQVKANGTYFPALVTAPVTASWVSSNRLTQADRLYATNESAMTAEANTTWNARLIRADNGAVLVTNTGIAATTTSNVLNTSYEGNVTMEVWASRDGYDSRKRHSCTFFLQQLLQQLIFPLTYDEKDSLNAVTLTRLDTTGPHITPAGFVGNGISARYTYNVIPSWVTSGVKLTIAGQVTAPVIRLAANRTMLFGLADNSNYDWLSLVQNTDTKGGLSGVIAVNSGPGSTPVSQACGRPGWKYLCRSPEILVGAIKPKPQAVLWLDATNILMTVHLDDTESRAYRIDTVTMAVTGQFTFGTTTRRHVATVARRSNGDIWFSDYDTNKLYRVDLAASFTSGNAVITSTYDTSILSPYVGSIEFVTVGADEYLLLAMYHTSESPVPYLYAIPATYLGAGPPFALADRYKRFQLGRRIQGIAMRDGKLMLSRNNAFGSASDVGYIEQYDIIGMLSTLADGDTVNATTNSAYLLKTWEGPSTYVEDIAVHPVTNDICVPTEGGQSLADHSGYLALWTSNLSVDGIANRYVIEYDGASTHVIKINGQTFGNMTATAAPPVTVFCIGGYANLSAGFGNRFTYATISNVCFQNQAMTQTQYNNLFSGSHETGVLTAYELTLTNPGAETGDTSGWAAETGGMVVRSANPPAFEGNSYFSGGPNVVTLQRQRLDLVAQGISAANLDTGACWATIQWRQASYDSSADPGTMGIRSLNAANTQIAVGYGTSAFTPGSGGASGPWYWYPRRMSQTLATLTRSLDALYSATGRTSGTENDHYVDSVKVTVYKP